MPPRPRILVSACLMGQPVRYDGQAKPLLVRQLEELSECANLFTFCPELAGGLPVPRAPAEISPGGHGRDVMRGRARIRDINGADITAPFVDGARQAVQFARDAGCTFALLTEASPSCGSFQIYSGHHDGKRRSGMGATTAALQAAGLKTFASDQVDALIRELEEQG